MRYRLFSSISPFQPTRARGETVPAGNSDVALAKFETGRVSNRCEGARARTASPRGGRPRESARIGLTPCGCPCAGRQTGGTRESHRPIRPAPSASRTRRRTPGAPDRSRRPVQNLSVKPRGGSHRASSPSSEAALAAEAYHYPGWRARVTTHTGCNLLLSSELEPAGRPLAAAGKGQGGVSAGISGEAEQWRVE